MSLRNAFCLSPAPRLPHLTSELASRSILHIPGFPPLQGVPAAPVRPRNPCYAPDHTLLVPSTPRTRALAADTFSPMHLHRHAALTFLSWNVGGVEALIHYVVNLIVALDVDFFALQEVWSFEAPLAAMPTDMPCTAARSKVAAPVHLSDGAALYNTWRPARA